MIVCTKLNAEQDQTICPETSSLSFCLLEIYFRSSQPRRQSRGDRNKSRVATALRLNETDWCTCVGSGTAIFSRTATACAHNVVFILVQHQSGLLHPYHRDKHRLSGVCQVADELRWRYQCPDIRITPESESRVLSDGRTTPHSDDLILNQEAGPQGNVAEWFG